MITPPPIVLNKTRKCTISDALSFCVTLLHCYRAMPHARGRSQRGERRSDDACRSQRGERRSDDACQHLEGQPPYLLVLHRLPPFF